MHYPLTEDLFLFPETTQYEDLSIWEEPESIVAEAAVPGVKKEDISIRFEQGILSIEAKRKPEKTRTYHQRAQHHFSYLSAIPGEIDEQTKPEASLSNGLLNIRFMKRRRAIAQKIHVK